MLNTKYNYISVEVPKTATTSIMKTMSNFDRESIRDGKAQLRKLISGHKHFTLSQYLEILPTNVTQNAFKFSFVRNPFDWLVSNFYCRGKGTCNVFHLRDNQPLRQQLINETENLTFKQWLNWYIDNIGWSQHMWLDGPMHFIGKYENLQTDFDSVCDAINVPRMKLLHENSATDRKSYQDYYDDEMKALVETHWAKDLERFGYSFSGSL